MPCPYLGTKEDSSLMFSEPNPNNACYAQFSEEKRLFRTVSIGYADVPRKTQQEWCLSEDKYVYCPYYAAKSKGGGEEPAVSQAEFIEPVMADAVDEDNGGIRKTAFLAGGLVLAALLVGALVFFLRGQPAAPDKDDPGKNDVPIAAPAPTEPAATPAAAESPSASEPTKKPEPKPGTPERKPTEKPKEPTPAKPESKPTPKPEPKPTPKPASSEPAGSRDWAAMNKLLSVSLEKKADERVVSLRMEEPPTRVESHYLKAHDSFPERFFVDLHGVCIPSKYRVAVGGHMAQPASEILVDDERVSLLKIAQNQKDPLVARVAVYLKLPAEYEIKQDGPEIRIHLNVD